MRKRSEEFGAHLTKLFFHGEEKLVKTFTFQVTEKCSLRCTYCYEANKKDVHMSFDTAKSTIDFLFANRKDPNFYFNEQTTQGLIIEFIGGEPLLEIKLISQIIDYFEQKCLENLDCPWSIYHTYSMSSNGIAYFTNEVQNLLQKYPNDIHIAVTVDGSKELHDKCRLFPDGSGSYDLAMSAALAELNNHNNGATKITVSPDNITYLYKGFVNMVKNGFLEIHANCVFEEGWTLAHAKELYQQLIYIADYIIENNLQDKLNFTFFEPDNYYASNSNNNWCGSTSAMLAVDSQGDIYPCIRFMTSSLGNGVEPYKIGDIFNGIGYDDITKKRLDELAVVTKSSQSDEKCLTCPIESGCSWCSGYNYQKFRTVNRRATYICQMHKAAALASKYFYKKCQDKISYDKIMVNENIALEILDEEEWKRIKNFND